MHLKTIAIIGTLSTSAVSFRGPLIRQMIAQGHKVYVFCSDYTNETRQAISDMGAHPVDSPFQRKGLNPLKEIGHVFTLARQLRDIRADICLTHFTKPNIFGMFAARMAKVPRRVMMVEGLGFAFTKRPTPDTFKLKLVRSILVFLYARSVKTAHHVIFLNNDDPKTFRDMGIKLPHHDILGAIGCSVKTVRVTPTPTDPVCFAFIGRFLKDKGIVDFLDAAVRLTDVRSIRFVALGDGDEANPETLSGSEQENYKQFSNIVFPGFVSDVQQWLEKKISVLVLPTYYREGFPRTVQEAMAAGRPAIVYDTPGARQSVVHNETGLIVPVFDTDKLVEAMRYFIDNPDELIRMGQNARKHAEKNYDEDKQSEKLLKMVINA